MFPEIPSWISAVLLLRGGWGREDEEKEGKEKDTDKKGVEEEATRQGRGVEVKGNERE